MHLIWIKDRMNSWMYVPDFDIHCYIKFDQNNKHCTYFILNRDIWNEKNRPQWKQIICLTEPKGTRELIVTEALSPVVLHYQHVQTTSYLKQQVGFLPPGDWWKNIICRAAIKYSQEGIYLSKKFFARTNDTNQLKFADSIIHVYQLNICENYELWFTFYPCPCSRLETGKFQKHSEYSDFRLNLFWNRFATYDYLYPLDSGSKILSSVATRKALWLRETKSSQSPISQHQECKSIKIFVYYK